METVFLVPKWVGNQFSWPTRCQAQLYGVIHTFAPPRPQVGCGAMVNAVLADWKNGMCLILIENTENLSIQMLDEQPHLIPPWKVTVLYQENMQLTLTTTKSCTAEHLNRWFTH